MPSLNGLTSLDSQSIVLSYLLLCSYFEQTIAHLRSHIIYHLHNNKSTKATNTNIIAETDHLHGIHIKDPFYCKLTETAYAKQ